MRIFQLFKYFTVEWTIQKVAGAVHAHENKGTLSPRAKGQFGKHLFILRESSFFFFYSGV